MKLAYRPEIDGLRAIAVGAVIAYHSEISILGLQPFKGGFIGVDIFFVISGYLITSIILKELITTGSFSFKHFYERRIRRILPALLLVMLVSLPFAWIYLLPTSFMDFSKSILYSLGFSSNFYFHFSGQQYGAIDGLYKPFLHTWSLSVEEQFYILFPIILLLTFKYFKKYLIHILITGFIISLGLTDWGSKNHPSITFYFLHTRAWELLAGSILAYFEITLGSRSRNQKLNLILPSVGLILIGHSILFSNNKMFYPLFNTLSPIIGVCLIIWFSHKDEIITKLFSTKLFVGIGLISYSLYLWHYPLFAFVKINGFASGDVINKLILIPILLILSIISFFLIEKIFREKKFNFKKLLIPIVSSYLILIIFNLIIIQKKGFFHRFENLKKINKNYNPDNFFLREKVAIKNSAHTNKISFKENKFKLLIIGDSHAGDLFNTLSLNNNLFNEIDIVFVGKKLVDILLKDTKLLKESDAILFSYRWDNEKLENFKKFMNKFKNFKKTIIVASRTNEYNTPNKLYTLLDHKVLFDKQKLDYYGLKKLYFENRIIHSETKINTELNELSKKEKFLYLNKEDYMCDILKKECDYLDKNGYKIFYDYGHYTLEGAKFFGRKIHEINWLKLN
ncbi:acyltransferase [Candidatus Pelagibacter sp.]|nr:acyltransferase [Candidatus Pelagibacter sp.]